jgi:hypothetical protein
MTTTTGGNTSFAGGADVQTPVATGGHPGIHKNYCYTKLIKNQSFATK